MEAFFILTILAIITNTCSARYYYNSGGYTSSSGGSIAAIVTSVVIVVVIVIIIIVLWRLKCVNRKKMGVTPSAPQMALSHYENQYASSSYNQAPPYGQSPVFEQFPPSYSTLNLKEDITKTPISS